MDKSTKSLFSISIGAYKYFMNKVERHWENIHPKSFKGYTLCKTGINTYVSDLNLFINSRTKFMIGSSLSSFNRNELSNFRKFPSTMIKSTPILIISILPGSMFIFPLLFLFPRILLTHYFWTEDQKSKFFQQDLQARLRYLKKFENDFIKKIDRLKNNEYIDKDMAALCLNMLTEMSTEKDISRLIPLFDSHLHIDILPIQYMRHIKASYPIPLNIFIASRANLKRFSSYLFYEDSHLQNENINDLPNHDLFELCLTRGINPYIHERQQLVEFLNQWIVKSCSIKDINHSLRIHLILLHSKVFQIKLKPKVVS